MEEIFIYTSTDPQEIYRIETAVQNAPGIRAHVSPESAFLMEERILPYIERADGQRHFGEEGVRRYLDGVVAQDNAPGGSPPM